MRISLLKLVILGIPFLIGACEFKNKKFIVQFNAPRAYEGVADGPGKYSFKLDEEFVELDYGRLDQTAVDDMINQLEKFYELIATYEYQTLKFCKGVQTKPLYVSGSVTEQKLDYWWGSSKSLVVSFKDALRFELEDNWKSKCQVEE